MPVCDAMKKLRTPSSPWCSRNSSVVPHVWCVSIILMAVVGAGSTAVPERPAYAHTPSASPPSPSPLRSGTCGGATFSPPPSPARLHNGNPAACTSHELATCDTAGERWAGAQRETHTRMRAPGIDDHDICDAAPC
jgi:hypothetical protein